MLRSLMPIHAFRGIPCACILSHKMAGFIYGTDRP